MTSRRIPAFALLALATCQQAQRIAHAKTIVGFVASLVAQWRGF